MAGRVVAPRNAARDVVLKWEFMEVPNQRYVWRALAADGSITQESAQTFAWLEDCAADLSRTWTVRGGLSVSDEWIGSARDVMRRSEGAKAG